ncbi:MAG: ATP-binding protein [Pseudomonadota bacterium]
MATTDKAAQPAPAEVKPTEARPDAETDASVSEAPRPPTPDEIVAMMDEAAAKDQSAAEKDESAPAANVASFWLLWAFIFVAMGAIGYVVLSARESGGPGLVVAGFLALLIALFVAAAAARMFSPVLLAGAMLQRATGKPAEEAAELAGAEILGALGLAERVLDADTEARLVTRRDGVVTYANRAYFDLAREAGVMGPAGLPPRIDRLFAQQGAEATKIFRLCRAAKSGEAAEETIYQVMGVVGGGVRRRFNVSVRAIRGSDEHVAWRLAEQPIDEEQHDILAAAYADFPGAVFALEKSGQIAWANAAMRQKLNVERGALRHIDDVVLGETGDLIRNLWMLDGASHPAMVRRLSQDPADGVFVAFRRGGVGEGFACVELTIDEAEAETEELSLSGDISESPFGVAIIDGELNRDGRIIQANKAFSDVFGGKKKNTPLSKIFNTVTLDELASEAKKKPRGGALPAGVEAAVGSGAQARVFALYPRPAKRRRGSYGARKTLLYSVDISDRKRMEEEYAQDQKLRGIGELASKVAHDFNNYLQVVLGHCERLMLKHPAGDPAYQELVQIRENAQRAANTTKQLLAFSRKQTLKREVLSITEVLRDFSRFLTRAIGEKVKLELINGRGLPSVKVDRYQLETAIMNLAVNARDAMAPAGGELTIRTRAVPAEEIPELNLPSLGDEDHLLIEVADTGPGVPEEIAAKIFDPFFTTKETGKGTGLGLSTVYGVIRQMGGAVALHSEPGEGAAFRIYLPAHLDDGETDEEAAGVVQDARSKEPTDLTGAGRILVVEDEDSVRTFVIATLGDCGYEITAAEDGEEALEILEEQGADFDVVLSDVMMSVVDGPTFVSRAREEFGLKAKVIFMSAYAEAAVQDQLSAIEDAGYIQKPFTLKGLAGLVKNTLNPPAEEEESE